jgi:hypothetical protein
MTMKKTIQRALLLAFAGLAAGAAVAADFDGSKPLICSTMEAHDCEAGESCERSLPDVLGLPQFVRIDFAAQALTGPKRTTPIKSIERSPGQVLMQGTELGFGWTLALDTASGKLAATLVNLENAVIVFGACTPQ